MDINTQVSSFVTLLVGFFIFIVYRIEKNDKDKSAANIILEEIRTIEKNIDKLKESGDFLSVIPANLSTTGWHDQRHLIVKYLDFDELTQIGLFFERVEALKEILTQWRQLYFEGLEAKATSLQATLIDVARNATDANTYQKEKARLTSIVHEENYWFEPSLFKDQLKSKVQLLTFISTTQIGNRLKRLSKKSWYSLW